ncbi:MAG TPA: NAD(P)-dependent oxidoreductase [Verrucomicrobiae bacterium]|nr:NAD(P)-dependent oxidoreductase [Verrucomicrobiae bacterium]
MKSITSNDTKIAWLGAGTMGAAMASNLAKAGYRVTIWNRTPSSPGLELAGSHGCTIAGTVEDALNGSQVICSCVTDGPALRSILFAPERNLKKLAAQDALIMDHSTIGPVEAKAITQELGKVGLRFVDAPVTGGDIGARDGTLTFMVGSGLEDLEFVRPLLNVMGKKIVHAGPIGSGQSLKLVNQLLCGVNLLAAVEAFQVAEKLGMDRKLVVEACGGGAAGSWQLVNLGPKIIAQDHRPGFRAAHLFKDLKFLRDALASASSRPAPPCFTLALDAFGRVTEMGKGELGTQTVWVAHPKPQ